ncbi:hypothetical protein CYMTET_26101 [Cymbomonas tetramitiformis]|uniref:Uncharacterized protein n=1 Tax=Cymbomonas tetramitiformis TaxID=36881 RepID=A0AAE0FST1_9CHLO|nr:hypothetical protein CYMTET_26101 [Cymbomonas tetramitiformis]
METVPGAPPIDEFISEITDAFRMIDSLARAMEHNQGKKRGGAYWKRFAKGKSPNIRSSFLNSPAVQQHRGQEMLAFFLNGGGHRRRREVSSDASHPIEIEAPPHLELQAQAPGGVTGGDPGVHNIHTVAAPIMAAAVDHEAQAPGGVTGGAPGSGRLQAAS